MRSQQELIERIARRVASVNLQRGHELPMLEEEYKALCDAGRLQPDQDTYRNLLIRKTWES